MSQFFLESSWWIPFYGLLGAILSLPWATGVIRRTGPRPAAYLNLLMTTLAFIHGSIVFRLTWDHAPVHLTLSWLQAAGLDLSLVLEVSPVSVGAMELVTGLSLLAQLFALGYMEKDWALARFYALLGFFEAAISGIALSDSLFLTYGLLEMLTLSTYLLVGFWYAQPLVVTAARDAFLTKRVGDVLLLMGVVAVSMLSGSLTFSDIEVWAETAELAPLTATLLGLALIAGPVGKCAQFPLHLWLDEAMEGPNPASILRNSIVVSGGAYVLIQLEPILALSPITDAVLIALGTATAIGASLVAIAQIDIKRTFSHSTSAYLGLVFVAVGLQQPDVALSLLLAHAFAKALLFMSVGSIIISTNTQDITEMGGLWSRMPVTTTAFLVGSSGMIALFPSGMFWTLDRWISGMGKMPIWLILTVLLVDGLTALNLTRVFGLVFAGKPQPKTRRTPEIFWPMAVPMVSLTIVTLLVPVMLQRWHLSWSVPSTETVGSNFNLLIEEAAVPLLLISSLIGVAIAGSIYLYGATEKPVKLPWKSVQDLLAYDFYIDKLYDLTVVFIVSRVSAMSSWIDRYVIDGLVNVFGLATLGSGEGLKYSISGQSQFYVFTITIGVGLIVALMLWQF